VQDFRGASSENLTSHNIYEGGYNLGLYIDYPVLAMTPTINSAIQNVTTRKTDPGTIFNPNRTDLGSTLGCVVALDVGGYGLGHGYAQSRFARGFLEQCWIDEIMWSIASTEGTFENGTPFAAADWSLVSNSPMGVGAWRDGIECSLGTGNPTGDIGEAEDHEFLGPVMVHLARGLLQDAAAHGKYRGGLGFNMGWLVDNPGGSTVFHFGGSPMGVGGCIVGLFGGYPALPYYVMLLRGTNARELISRGISLPSSFVEANKMLAEGTLTASEVTNSMKEAPDWQVDDGDLIYVATEMGSSWGEPLDRDPIRVADDVTKGWISSGVAETVYGVIVGAVVDGCEVDDQATAAQRLSIKARRGKRAVSVRDWWVDERKRVTETEFPELTRAMYKDCLKHETFRGEFLSFWQLPEDYVESL
jgi:acetone carboxylase alpha subunit